MGAGSGYVVTAPSPPRAVDSGRRPGEHRGMQRLVLVAALAVSALLLLPSAASAQASQVSELWREWAVLEKQWRVERAEVQTDRRRLRARREGRNPDAPPKRRAPGR